MKKTAILMAATVLVALSGAAHAGGPLQTQTEKPVVVAKTPKSKGGLLIPLIGLGGAAAAAALFGTESSSGSHGSNIDS